MQISELKPGQTARVVKLAKTDKIYRQRLIAMGLIPGTIFTLLRTAPLGDPLEIAVRGYTLSLRKDEAKLVEIEEEIER